MNKNDYNLLILLFCIIFVSSGYTESEYDTSVLNCLPNELVKHLIHSDDSTLAEFGREVGLHYLQQNASRLSRQILELSPEHDGKKLISILHYNKRIANILKREYHNSSLLNSCRFIEQHSLPVIHEITTLRHKIGAVYDDPTLDITAKLEKTYAFLEKFERLNDRYGIARSHLQLAEIYGDMGETEKQFKLLKKAAREYEENGHIGGACQALAVIGLLHKQAGNIDSMLICYEKAKTLAYRSRHPTQAARILIFYCSYYRQIGRYAITHDLLSEALTVCREFKGGFIELRFILVAMRFYADLECWRVVESLYNRAEILLQRYKDEEMRAAVAKLLITRKDVMHARILMSRGDVIKAEHIFDDAQDKVKDLPFITEYAELLLFWSIGLFMNGEYDSALNRIHAGLQYTEEQPLRDYPGHFLILLAKTELLRGKLANAERALQDFKLYAATYSGDLRIEWVEYYATLGSIQLQRGEEEQALHTLGKGLDYLEKEISEMDASVHTYLWLGKSESIRMLMHDLVSRDPALGYGAELYWRDLYRKLGSGKRSDPQIAGSVSPDPHPRPVHVHAEATVLEKLYDRALQAKQCIAEHSAVHCLYLIRDDELWRWTISAGGIRREILDCTVSKARRLALETRSQLAATDNHSGDAIQPGLAGNLRLLARALLPPEVGDEDTTRMDRLFLVTADGFLGSIPFEAFNVGSERTYTPLLARTDVAYARFIGCRRDGGGASPGIILSNTHASQELRSRYLFQPSLSEVTIEAETAASLDPDAVVLSGASATKDNLMDSWEDASYLYFATHIFSDPEIPYLVHIPLAQDRFRIGIESTYLDVTDIRLADLGGCDLVVLSGCSSGVPYMESRTEGPSLGDAFLDAGAGAVVQTLWDVRDDMARELMTTFIRLANGTRASRIHALCETRRQAMYGPDGIRHPSIWASYTIELGGLPVD